MNAAHWLAKWWLTALILLGTGYVWASSTAAAGYVGWWMPSGWRALEGNRLDRIYFFDIEIQADGTLGDHHGWPDKWQDLREYAATKDTPLEVSVSLMNAAHFHRIFSNPTAIKTLEDAIFRLAMDAATSGVHVDVEMYGDLNARDIAAYRFFLQRLSQRLAALSPRKGLSIFLPFQTKSFLYDRETLGFIDHVVVQGYDSHWADGKVAGPVAPLDGPYALTWKSAVAAADRLGIARGKQFLSFPLYGYEWHVSSGDGVRRPIKGKGLTTSYAPLSKEDRESAEIEVNVLGRVLQYGSRYDAVAASSSYRFISPDGKQFEGWYDDWLGLQKKTEYLKKEKLGGVAFFLLGYDGGALVNPYLQESEQTRGRLNSDPPTPPASGP